MAADSDKGSIFSSRKAQIVVIGIAAVLGIALGGAALGLTDEQKQQAIGAVQWFVGLLLGGHTLTDIAHNVTASRERVAAERETTARAAVMNGGTEGGES